MLEVMNTSSAELSCTGGDSGILLNCWDKSSPLIKELERTVNFAERKCGDLMQELHFYKEYYEKWAQVERVNHVYRRKKFKKCCRQIPVVGSSVENELEKVNQYLCRRIKCKINEMNNEITQANRKIQSKYESFSSRPKENFSLTQHSKEPTLEKANDLPSQIIENKTCKSEPTVTYCDVNSEEKEEIEVTGKLSSKSVPARNKTLKYGKKDGKSFKRRYCNLQRYKIRSKSLPQGVRRKFGFGGFFEVFEPEAVFTGSINSRNKSRISLKPDSTKGCKSRKSKTRLSEIRRLTPRSSRHRLTKSKSGVRHCLRNENSEPETKKNENIQSLNETVQRATKNICKALVPSNSIPNLSKTEFALSNNLQSLIAKPTSLLPFLRHPIPFIPCSSTSRSFNLGLNVQQVLSLLKRKKHSVTLQTVVRNSMQAARSLAEPKVNTLFISQTTTSHNHATPAICPAREGSEDSFSIVSDNRSKCSLLRQIQTRTSQNTEDKIAFSEEPVIEINKLQRPEDVWVMEQPDSTSKGIRNSRSRCTCFPSKHYVEYHKVLRQYTGWRLPGGSRADTQSSHLCTKPKDYIVTSEDKIESSGEENDKRIELFKIHNDLLNLTRKYSSLQEQISQNCLDDYEANAELDAMESELAIREIEFKDILHFYNKLMTLKEKLKCLRMRNTQSQLAARQLGCERPKKDPLRPTPSMALAKVLKKIQGLQDKINLIDTP